MPVMTLLRMLLGWRGLAIAGVLATSYGCPDNCLQIQDDLCNCYGKTTDEIQACETNASTQESVSPPDSKQLDACGKLVNGCNDAIKGGDNCPVLQTIAGQQACGLAQTDTQADAG
jgi:hypothetical protein